jgi:hypothetical protein
VSRLYEVATQVTLSGTAAPLVTVLAGATTQCGVRELSVSVVGTATTRLECNIAPPAAAGTGAPTGTLVQAADGDENVAGQATLVTSFATTQPTVPVKFYRRQLTGTLNGSGFTCIWGPGELVLAVNAQLVIWSLAGNGVFDCYVKVAE